MFPFPRPSFFIYIAAMTGYKAAHDFEERTGASGIAGRYILPAGMEEPSLESFIDRSFDQAIEHAESGRETPNEALLNLLSVMDQIRDLNAGNGLEHIPVNRGEAFEVGHFLMGVVSGYNADDIRYYLHERAEAPSPDYFEEVLTRGGTLTREMPGHEDYLYHLNVQALEDKIGVPIRWFPSPKTIHKMKTDLGLGEWAPSAQDMERAEIRYLSRSYDVRYLPIRLMHTDGATEARMEL